MPNFMITYDGRLHAISASLLDGTTTMFSLDGVLRQDEMYDKNKVRGEQHSSSSFNVYKSLSLPLSSVLSKSLAW